MIMTHNIFMPIQTFVGYTISYDKETGKLVLEIFDL